eukprot:g73819.t1
MLVSLLRQGCSEVDRKTIQLTPAEYREWLLREVYAVCHEGVVFGAEMSAGLLDGAADSPGHANDPDDGNREDAPQIESAHPASQALCPADTVLPAEYRAASLHPAAMRNTSDQCEEEDKCRWEEESKCRWGEESKGRWGEESKGRWGDRAGLSPLVCTRPLLGLLVARLARWALTGVFPLPVLSDGPAAPALRPELTSLLDHSRLTLVYGQGPALAATTRPLPQRARADELRKVLQALGPRGVLTLLGLACTTGSVDRLPPTADRLRAAFRQLHDPRPHTRMTVGARALAKHAPRASDGWWGRVQGPDSQKNWAAEQVLSFVLARATWANLHGLPHDVEIYELRVQAGYGARWSADGSVFRGFLEVPLPDGHAVGWRH